MSNLINNLKLKLVKNIATELSKNLENSLQKALDKKDFARFYQFYEIAAGLNFYLIEFYNIYLD
jgi:hypothetical protein